MNNKLFTTKHKRNLGVWGIIIARDPGSALHITNVVGNVMHDKDKLDAVIKWYREYNKSLKNVQSYYEEKLNKIAGS